jgi:hypothetical protein
MKTKLATVLLLILILATSCVQKTYKKTVVFTVDVSKIKNIKKVGIRGNDKPLSWDHDTEMQAIKKDRIYQITLPTETGYKFTEVKFSINDNLESNDGTNRRIVFSEKDTTFYKAKL